MTPAERRNAILAALRSEGDVAVEELAERLGASRETIRRDLAELDGRGLLRKVHGGAVAVEPGGGIEGPLSQRMGIEGEAKRRIARRAAALLSPGDSLFVDTGSTTLVFAEELAAVPGLTVLTNSAAIAALAAKGEESRVFLLGGEYRRGGGECVGEAVLAQIGRFRASHAVLTVAALDARGFSDHDGAEAEIARAMIRQAGAVTVLADATKIGRSALCALGPLGAAQRVVSNTSLEELDADFAQALREASVEWVHAP